MCLQEMVKQPFQSQIWTWCLVVPQWIQQFAIPYAPQDIRTAYLGAGWQVLPPEVLVEVVKACIMARECGIQWKLPQPTAAQTMGEEVAEFGRNPLTRARVGGKPQDQAGLASLLRCRIRLHNQPHMAELITEVRALGPNSALSLGQ
jgi:hypothetical protein